MMKNLPALLGLYALLFAFMTSLPYLVGAASAPPGWEYSGALPVPAGFQVDYNSHLAKMWQGARGQWDYQLLFTHEAHPGLPGVQIFYVALGALAKFAGLSFPTGYQVARFALSMAIVPLLWAFASRFFTRARDCWNVVFFGTAIMGWGWLLFFITPDMTAQVAPIEFWLSDAYHFTGALYMPHFSAAICLQMVALLAFSNWLNRPSAQSILMMTLALAADSLIQPYVVLLTFPLFACVILGQWLIQWRTGTRPNLTMFWLLIPALAHGGIALWQYGMITAHPVWKNFSDQNITHSPEPIYYLFGYLPLLLPIAMLAWKRIQHLRVSSNTIDYNTTSANNASVKWLMPTFWILLVMLLLYAPTVIQRRYLLGVQTPLAVFAVAGWASLLKNVPLSRWRFFTLIYIAFGAITPLLLLFSNSAALAQSQNNPAFYTPDELAGYHWLRENAAPDDTILTTMNSSGTGSGGRLVAMTGQRVFIGHWIETAHFQEKVGQLAQFYTLQTEDSWRRKFLESTGIRYLWYDDYARAFGAWHPATAAYLQLVFESDTVQIYQVLF